MRNNYEDYRDLVGFDGMCALVYAICSADLDEIAVYDEKTESWENRLWKENGNYCAAYIPEDANIGVTAQEALDRFDIKPFIVPEEMMNQECEG